MAIAIDKSAELAGGEKSRREARSFLYPEGSMETVPATLTTCDDCGGPAYWTIIQGEVYYSCKSQCDGFMQLDLFPEPGMQVVVDRVTGAPSSAHVVTPDAT